MVVTIKQLLEAGVHFGHQKGRWNPKMAHYIYTARNDIHIIDLQKAQKKIKEAYELVKSVAEQEKYILFVGTKKQAAEAIEEEARRCQSPYVTRRWLGGTLTNFSVIRKSVELLLQLERWEKEGMFEKLSPKEAMKMKEKKEKLSKYLEGIKHMEQLPGLLYIVDTKKERTALLEAKKMGIPIVGIVDTNCDPEEVDVCIPGNDDATKAVKLITSIIAEAVLEGKRNAERKRQVVEKMEEIAAK